MTQRNAHPTKSGPGRRHEEGVQHGAPPVPTMGGAWVGQRVNPNKPASRRDKRRSAVRAAKGSA